MINKGARAWGQARPVLVRFSLWQSPDFLAFKKRPLTPAQLDIFNKTMDLNNIIAGKVWKLGDHVNTDMLHPPAFFSLDRDRLEQGIREGMDRLGATVKGDYSNEGLVIVAGENFGCGSSRESSVRALASIGVRAVVARSFARIFFRSLANLGIPPLVCSEAGKEIEEGRTIRLFLKKGFLEQEGAGRFPLIPLDSHIEKLLLSGGLISYLKRELHGI